MIGNIKEIFPPKTGLREKQVLQDPGYVEGVETTCCMLHAAWYLARFARLYEIPYVEGVKRNKNSHNTVDLRHLSLMSKE